MPLEVACTPQKGRVAERARKQVAHGPATPAAVEVPDSGAAMVPFELAWPVSKAQQEAAGASEMQALERP